MYPSGMFDTNKDNALLSDGTDIVNTVATPTLSRGASSVSYTHLDVYKRQVSKRCVYYNIKKIA